MEQSKFKKIINKVLELIRKLAAKIKNIFYSHQTLKIPASMKPYYDYVLRDHRLSPSLDNADELVDEAIRMLGECQKVSENVKDGDKYIKVTRGPLEKTLDEYERIMRKCTHDVTNPRDSSGRLTPEAKRSVMLGQLIDRKMLIVNIILIAATNTSARETEKRYAQYAVSSDPFDTELKKLKERHAKPHNTLESFISYCDTMMIAEGI